MSDNFDSFSRFSAIGRDYSSEILHSENLGQLASFTVEVDNNAVSALQNSAEELTFSYDNHKEQKQLKRKGADKTKSKLIDNIEKAKALNQALNKMRSSKSFAMRLQQIKSLLENSSNFDLQSLKELLFGNSKQLNQESSEHKELLSKNLSEQTKAFTNKEQELELFFLLKQSLLELNRQYTDQSKLDQLNRLLSDLESNNTEAINASLITFNLDLEQDLNRALNQGGQLGSNLDQVKSFDFVKDIAFSFANVCTSLNEISDLYLFLNQKFDGLEFRQAIDSMRKSVAVCLSSVSNDFNFDHDNLAVIGQNLSFLNQARSVTLLVDDLLVAFKAIINGSDSSNLQEALKSVEKIDSAKFAMELYELSKRTIISDPNLRQLYKEIEALDATSEVLLGQKFLATVKSINENFFASLDQRDRFISACLNFVDHLVEQEDEYLASLEDDDF